MDQCNRPAQHTIRQQLVSLLRSGGFSARELSGAVHIGEKEVYQHLAHIDKSAAHLRLRLQVEPAVCRNCGFVFAKRERLTKPGKCPVCRGTFVEEPRFSLEEE